MLRATHIINIPQTTGVIQLFFLVMLLHPEVQLEAQEEIDRVIGSDRLPSLQDRDALPYVEAILLECLRLQPMAPTCMHRLILNGNVSFSSSL